MTNPLPMTDDPVEQLRQLRDEYHKRAEREANALLRRWLFGVAAGVEYAAALLGHELGHRADPRTQRQREAEVQ